MINIYSIRIKSNSKEEKYFIEKIIPRFKDKYTSHRDFINAKYNEYIVSYTDYKNNKKDINKLKITAVKMQSGKTQNEGVSMNNLTNRQLAGKLLLEAVELLNESNARHKYIKLQEEKAEKMQKRSEHARSDDASIYEAKAKQARANIARYGTGASKGGYNGGIAYTFTDKSETDAKKANLHGTMDGGKTFSHDNLKENEVIYGGKLAKKNFNDMVDKRSKNTTVGYSGKGVNYDLHERINKHGKKSQNETISELLIEAAMLLTEGVGVKDKSTDKVVKVFKDNKEATEWIIANGGNEKYRLTNELK